MAYFANGTEAMLFMEHQCFGCIHEPNPEEGIFCAVWAAHEDFPWFFENNEAREVLDVLIPQTDPDVLPECSMYVEDPLPKQKETLL